MKRTIIAISIIVGALGIVGLGAFLSLRGGGGAPPVATTPDEPTGGLGTAPSGGGEGQTPTGQGGLPVGAGAAQAVFSGNAQDYFINEDGSLLVVENNGSVSRVANGQAQSISENNFVSFANASFSYDGKKVLAEIGERDNTTMWVFDMETAEWKDSGIVGREFVWSPDDYSIAYITPNKEFSSLALVGAESLRPRTLATFSAQSFFPQWVSSLAISLFEIPTALFKSAGLVYGIRSQSVTPIIEGLGASVLWSEDGRGLLFVAQEGGGGTLTLISSDGEPTQGLSFVTLPEKCVFHNTTSTSTAAGSYLTCAIPRNSDFSFANLPDDYLVGAVSAQDGFFRVNLDSGSVDALAESSPFDATDLKATDDALYFINRADHRLYSLPF